MSSVKRVEAVVLRDEVGLAIHLDEHADFRAGQDGLGDDAFLGVAIRLSSRRWRRLFCGGYRRRLRCRHWFRRARLRQSIMPAPVFSRRVLATCGVDVHGGHGSGMLVGLKMRETRACALVSRKRDSREAAAIIRRRRRVPPARFFAPARRCRGTMASTSFWRIDADGANGVVVAGDRVVDEVRIGVRIDDGDDRDAEALAPRRRRWPRAWCR